MDWVSATDFREAPLSPLNSGHSLVKACIALVCFPLCAAAQFATDRPSFGSTATTVDPGHVMFEFGYTLTPTDQTLQHSIGEVENIFDVATSLIRFWESEFDSIKPRKNRKGNRQFTTDDIRNVKLIYHLVKEKGYTLQGAKSMLKNGSKSAMDRMEMVESLKNIRVFLSEIKNRL